MANFRENICFIILCENCCEKISFPKSFAFVKISQKQKEAGDFREKKTNLDAFSENVRENEIFEITELRKNEINIFVSTLFPH